MWRNEGCLRTYATYNVMFEQLIRKQCWSWSSRMVSKCSYSLNTGVLIRRTSILLRLSNCQWFVNLTRNSSRCGKGWRVILSLPHYSVYLSSLSEWEGGLSDLQPLSFGLTCGETLLAIPLEKHTYTYKTTRSCTRVRAAFQKSFILL